MATSEVPNQFHGWLGHDKSSIQGKMRWEPFTPKPFSDSDVDIAISHCGVCGSDCHTLRSGWGPTLYPVVVGHEIIGRAVRVGSAVSHIKVGDRVGVGAQSGSCLKPECPDCSENREQHCLGFVQTYNGQYEDGNKSYGGYATHARVPAHFVITIPSSLKSEDAAPMLCGGITVFSPLRDNEARGKRVGIVGLGGLGHFGVLFAKAMGAAKVVAISRSSSKHADALKMGADSYIATAEDDSWATRHSRSLDLIVSTVSSPSMPLEGYLSMLAPRGCFVQVGAPEDKLPSFSGFSLITKTAKLGGSCIGSPRDIREMLEFAAEKGVKPWVVTRKMSEANEIVRSMDAGKARYRYVLVNDGVVEEF